VRETGNLQFFRFFSELLDVVYPWDKGVSHQSTMRIYDNDPNAYEKDALEYIRTAFDDVPNVPLFNPISTWR
jgi:hypothetical protein